MYFSQAFCLNEYLQTRDFTTQLDSFTYCCCSFFLNVSTQRRRKEKLKYKKNVRQKFSCPISSNMFTEHIDIHRKRKRVFYLYNTHIRTHIYMLFCFIHLLLHNIQRCTLVSRYLCSSMSMCVCDTDVFIYNMWVGIMLMIMLLRALETYKCNNPRKDYVNDTWASFPLFFKKITLKYFSRRD